MPEEIKPSRAWYLNAPQWRRARDSVCGLDAIQGGGTLYLPQPGAMKQTDYVSYLRRAEYFNAPSHVLEAIISAIFRVPVEHPEVDWLDDVGFGVGDLTRFGMTVARDMVSIGLGAIWIDWDDDRPVFRWIPGDDIWTIERDAMGVSRVVAGIEDTSLVEFTRGRSGRVRVTHYLADMPPEKQMSTAPLQELLPISMGGSYVNSGALERLIYPQMTMWTRRETRTPMIRGSALMDIPLLVLEWPGRDDDGRITPPLMPLVDAALSHYRLSADLRHCLHFAALPTPWITGAKPKNSLVLGSQEAWLLDNPQSQVGMLEFSGAGAEQLREEMMRVETRMAYLGGRLLQPSDARAAETEETVRLRASVESSTMARLAEMLEDALRRAVELAGTWAAETVNVEDIKVSREFLDTRVTPQMLNAMVEAWSAGALPTPDLVWGLRQGDALDPSRTPENVIGDIERKEREARRQQMQAARATMRPNTEGGNGTGTDGGGTRRTDAGAAAGGGDAG